MTVNLTLYLVCAFGGITAYFVFYGMLHALLRKKSGDLCYKGEVSARREQSRGAFSGFVYVAILILFYVLKVEQGNMQMEMYLFVALVGLFVGRSLFPLLIVSILPNGIYENGIVTKRNLILFDKIKKFDIYEPEKQRDDGVLFLRLYTFKKETLGPRAALMIDRKDKAKIRNIMKQRMAEV